MNSNERLYKKPRLGENLDPSKTFILVDSTDFRKPVTISIETIGKALQLKIDQDLEWKNTSAVQPEELGRKPETNPDKLPISPKTHISVDENYLYVWVPQSQKWKRIPLSDWPQE
jgi:hypothetical protein